MNKEKLLEAIDDKIAEINQVKIRFRKVFERAQYDIFANDLADILEKLEAERDELYKQIKELKTIN